MAERLHLDRSDGYAERFRERDDLQRFVEVGADECHGARKDRIVDGERIGRTARDDARVGDVHKRFRGTPVQEVVEDSGA